MVPSGGGERHQHPVRHSRPRGGGHPPRSYQGLLGSAIGLMCFHRMPQQYAFAGQFLFIDPMAQDHLQETAVHIAKGRT